jgi:outer membrane protein OmpA-like peptidoglycan-associated protein/outer membrane scaffolding protein for murein synthesis (MipA/OmpV family)
MNRWWHWTSLAGICLLALAASIWLGPKPAAAQDVDLTLSESAGIEESLLGLGVGFAPDYEGSNEYEPVPLLQARINWRQGYFLSFLGNSLRANLVPSHNWHLGPLLRYRMERDDVEDDEVDDMKKVDAAVEVGAFGGYSGEHWLAVLSMAKDVAAGHHGSLAELGLGYRIPFQEFGHMTLFASTSYADSDYMDTYFSVDAVDAARSGLSRYSADSGFKDVGAGVAWQCNFNRNWGMLALARYTRLLDDAKDSPVVDDQGDADQIFGGVILNYRFGGEEPEPEPVMDSDRDGVPDDLDQCPDTPYGVQVDAAGCPIDSDGDGVPDYLDKCPDTPAGVQVDAVGCPIDSDGDGVPDYRDECPDTPKGAPVDEVGCPLDSDGDGVPDYLDRCPGTLKGVKVDEVGCPLSMSLHINFDFDKADIKPEFKPELDRAAEFILKYPEVPQIVIEGHTDSRGREVYNQRLSERRARSVRQYLIDNYSIEAKRLVAVGRGESMPVADNATEEGRYQNRRVEIVCCAVVPE